jgi:hypothetical protein
MGSPVVSVTVVKTAEAGVYSLIFPKIFGTLRE